MPRVGKADRHGGCRELVFGLHKQPAILRKFRPQDFHHRGPGSDRVGRSIAHACRDESVSDGLVAIHCDLRPPALFVGGLKMIKLGEHVFDRISVARLERHQRRFRKARVLPAEPFANQRLELFHVEIEDRGEQAEHENILSLVLRRASQRLNRQARNRDADIDIALVVQVGLNAVGVVQQHAAFLQRTDVAFITVLVEGHQKIRLIARRQNLPRADADLEDRSPARNRGGDGHVGHHLLIAAPREPREKTAERLNAVLGITGEPDDGIANALGAQVCPTSRRDWWRGSVWKCVHDQVSLSRSPRKEKRLIEFFFNGKICDSPQRGAGA